jgi:N utilization substance protein A
MSKEMLMVVDAVANEKGVSSVISMRWRPLASAVKRYAERTWPVSRDRNTGEYETFRGGSRR